MMRASFGAAFAAVFLAACAAAGVDDEWSEDATDAGVASADGAPAELEDGAASVDAGPKQDAAKDAGKAPKDATTDASPPNDPDPEPDAYVPPPPTDASLPPTDAGTCVDHVTLPESSTYYQLFAKYRPTPITFVTKTYSCPDVFASNSCNFAMRQAGATVDPTTGKYILKPTFGACRITVPDKCRPCTGTVTEW